MHEHRLDNPAQPTPEIQLPSLDLNRHKGTKFRITTEDAIYTIIKNPDGISIEGHSTYCPKPTKVNIFSDRSEPGIIKISNFFLYLIENERLVTSTIVTKIEQIT